MAAEQSKGHVPLSGVLLCCTSIGVDQRDELHKVASSMGARCFFDLTVQVTHLLVGDITTAKYNYVAKERPDIKVVLPEFVRAAREAWMNGDEIDIQQLEDKHRAPTLYGLHICVTGYTDHSTRENFIQQITENGAKYSGDLTKQATHLIAREPSGKKYDVAPTWGIKVVGEEWLLDSLERGMALDESLYDLKTEPSKRGKGAWNKSYVPESVALRKRPRDEAQEPEPSGRRKIRRNVSSKLSSEHETIWQDIAAAPTRKSPQMEWQEGAKESSVPIINAESPPTPKPTKMDAAPDSKSTTTSGMNVGQSNGVFAGTVVNIHGFNRTQFTILQGHLTSHGAKVIEADGPSAKHGFTDTNTNFLITPHNVPSNNLPPVSEHLRDFTRVTEWWVESCLFRKLLLSPSEFRLTRPFYTQPIPGFKSLIICSTSFHGPEVLQVSKMVNLLGASYDQYLKAGVSVLVCGSSAPSEDKLRFARENSIPTVTADWMWACIDAGEAVPFEDFYFGKLSPGAGESGDTFTSGSHETVQTMSMPTAPQPKKKKQTERPETQRRKQFPKLVTEPQSDTPRTVQGRHIEPPRASNKSTHCPQPASEPLSEIPPQKLNSPSKRSTQFMTASPEQKAPASGPMPENPASSAKSEHLTNALSLMLAAKRASRTVSQPEESLIRRKRAALGRASSASFDTLDPGKSSLVREPSSLANETVAEEQDSAPTIPEFLPSQKITYADAETQARKARLLAELGGAADEASGLAQSETVERKRKTSAAKGKSAKSRAKRKSSKHDDPEGSSVVDLTSAV